MCHIYSLRMIALFFCNAYIMEINEVKDILAAYSIISGQMANFKKSAAYFSKGAFSV